MINFTAVEVTATAQYCVSAQCFSLYSVLKASVHIMMLHNDDIYDSNL